MENKKITILAVDDIPDNLISLKALFYEVFQGFELITALDGNNGIELAQKHNPDVILLDIVMPGMDGFETCRKIKENPDMADIPVVFLTALKADKESRVKALEVGAEAFLAKPIDLIEFTAQIKAMLKIREANLAKKYETVTLKRLVDEKTRELELNHQNTLKLYEELKNENIARKKSEELLLKSEKRFKTISELTSDIAYSCCKYNNGSYSLDWMTGAIENITGYTYEEIKAQTCWKFMVDEEFTEIFEKSVVGISPGTSNICELKIIRKDGVARWLKSYVRIIKEDEDENTERLYGGLVDITHNKVFLETLRESEEKFKTSFEASNVGKSITSLNGEINVNQAFCDMLGYSAEELKGKTWREFTPKEEIPVVEAYLQPLLDGEKKSTRFNKSYIGKGGHAIWCDVSVTLIRDKDDKPLHYLTALVNINDKLQAEKLMKESEEKFRLAFMTSPDSINLNRLDDGMYIDSNIGFTEIMGYTREEVVGKTALDLNLWVNTEDRQKLVEALQSKGYIENLEAEFRDKYGKIHTGLMSARLIEVNNEKVILNITRDITDRKEAEKKLQLATKNWQDTFDAIQDAIAILDTNHQIIQHNKSFKRLIRNASNVNNEFCYLHVHKTECPPDGCPLVLLKNSLSRESREMRIHGKTYNILVDPIFDDHHNVTGAVHIMTDITKNKLIERQLINSEQRFKYMIEKSPQTISLLTEDDHFIYASPAAFRTFGYTPEELGQLNPNALTHPDDLEKMLPSLEKMISEPGSTCKLVYRFRCKDGSWKWLESTFTNLIHEPSIGAIVINSTDINEKYEAEQDRRELEEKYKTLIEISQDAVFINEDMKITFINAAGLKLFGAEDQSQVLGHSPLDFFHPDHHEMIQDRNNKMIHDGIPARIKEEKIIRIDGTLVDVEVSATVFEFHGKKAIQMVLRDISDRKKNDLIREIQYDIAEAVVRSKSLGDLFHVMRESLSRLVDTTNFALALYEPGSDTITLPFSIDHATSNPATVPVAKSLTGRVIQQKRPLLLTKEDIKLLSDKGEINLFGARAELWLGIPLIHTEKVIGAIIIQSYNNPDAFDEAGLELLTIIAHQLAIYVEKKKDEAELIIAKEKAEESDRLKTAFLNNMSHEIRTPLNGITGFTNILSFPETTHEDIETYAPLIKNASDQLCNIIDDIICIATIEAGQEVLRNAPADINLIMKDLYSEYKDNPDTNKIIINYRTLLSDKHSKVVTDEAKLTKILRNLISNAIKFTNQGIIEFTCEPEERFLHFKVRDTGIGIPKEHQSLIFERFRQVQQDRDRKFGGNGLGLAISKAYAEMMGGKIWFESEPGKGTLFHFTILYEPLEAVLSSTYLPENQQIDYLTLNNKTILVAEDEWSNYMLLEKLLEPYNFRIIHALNGVEAVEATRKFPDLDLVLMDLKMPEMDGFEATRIIKKEKPFLPVIAVTAYALSGDRENALQAGCDDYISKPLRISTLMGKINLHKRIVKTQND